jgi:hypothetical protein
VTVSVMPTLSALSPGLAAVASLNATMMLAEASGFAPAQVPVLEVAAPDAV